MYNKRKKEVNKNVKTNNTYIGTNYCIFTSCLPNDNNDSGYRFSKDNFSIYGNIFIFCNNIWFFIKITIDKELKRLYNKYRK